MNYSYKFPVVKGAQAGRDYYIGMVPLKMLDKLFPNEEEYVLPEYRAQRRLNENRIPEIKKYILDNMDSYVFSALAASIDGEYRYIPSDNTDVGILEVSMDAKFLINDGQHRKAAILAAIKENQELGNETISVVFYSDMGLERSQQMFTDLNKHAVKTSNSIAELYDSRDELAVVTRKVVTRNKFYNEFVDKERDILGKFSSSLFTLNTFYTANKRILRRAKCDEQFEIFLEEFWGAVQENMVPWIDLQEKEISKRDLRESYIASQAVVIQAFGKVGAYYLLHPELDFIEQLKAIRSINWKRSADEWRLRVLGSNGRMINNEKAIQLAANIIKISIGIPLSDDERKEEEELKKNIIVIEN